MKKILFIFLLVLSFFTAKNSVFAATYFVASSGSDSNPGTSEAAPWKTLDKVNKSTFQPGDSIKLKKGGVWYEPLNINFSGTSGNPITIASYGEGEKPIIHAGTLVTSWSSPDANGVCSSIGWCNGIIEDNVSIRGATSKECNDGFWYFDQPANTFYYKPTMGAPSDHLVFRVNRGAVISFVKEVHYVTIDGIKLLGGQLYKGSGDYKLSNITIQNCDFDQSGIWIDVGKYTGSYDDFIIRNNFFKYCMHNIYLIAQDDYSDGWVRSIISRNIFRNSNGMHDGKKWNDAIDADGISLQNQRDSVIEYNDISGHCDAGGGITHWVGENHVATGNVFRYNYIHDIGGYGIVVGTSDNATNCKIYGNVIANFGTSKPFPWSIGWGGLRLNSPQVPNPSEVYNNIIYNGDFGLYLNGLTDNYILRNNLVLGMRQYNVVRDEYGIRNNVLSNNLYYPDGPEKFRYQGKLYDLAGWKNITHQDAGSLFADPLFLNASGNFSSAADFKLAAGSPAIDVGADVGLIADFEGTPVPQGSAPDIGAFEWKAAAPAYDKADLNQDHSIDSVDLDILKTDFLRLTANLTNPRSDINLDGQCTVRDLGILMSGWGK